MKDVQPHAMTLAQAAKESGVDERKLRNAIAKGALAVVRVGPFNRLRVTSEELKNFVYNGTNVPISALLDKQRIDS